MNYNWFKNLINIVENIIMAIIKGLWGEIIAVEILPGLSNIELIELNLG